MQEPDYRPEGILAGGCINDDMGFYVVAQAVRLTAPESVCSTRDHTSRLDMACLPRELADILGVSVGVVTQLDLPAADFGGMSGGQPYLGYGTSADAMISVGRFRITYQVP